MMARKISARICLWILLLVGSGTVAAQGAGQSFAADPHIQKMAEAYAQDAVDYSERQFGIKLDWSDGSIANLESALSRLHASYTSTKPAPTDEQVMQYAKAYGSYVGEVYRRNHGATWGVVTLGGQRMPGLKASSGASFWPWAKVFNRITHGDEDNVSFYYTTLLSEGKK